MPKTWEQMDRDEKLEHLHGETGRILRILGNVDARMHFLANRIDEVRDALKKANIT